MFQVATLYPAIIPECRTVLDRPLETFVAGVICCGGARLSLLRLYPAACGAPTIHNNRQCALTIRQQAAGVVRFAALRSRRGNAPSPPNTPRQAGRPCTIQHADKQARTEATHAVSYSLKLSVLERELLLPTRS